MWITSRCLTATTTIVSSVPIIHFFYQQLQPQLQKLQICLSEFLPAVLYSCSRSSTFDLQLMRYSFHHPLAATSRFLRPRLSRVTHPAYPSKEYVLQAHTPVCRRRRGLIINGYHRLHGCRYNYQLSSHRWRLQKMFTQSELLPHQFYWVNKFLRPVFVLISTFTLRGSIIHPWIWRCTSK